MSDVPSDSGSRSRSAHTVLMAVLLAVPVLKLAWTLGGGDAARDTLVAMGPGNWVDVPIGLFLTEPLLATVLVVVVSRTTYAYFAARGGAARHQDTRTSATAATATVVPAALGVVVGAFNGLAWGLAAGLLSYVLRVGVMVEYGTGRRSHSTGRRTGRPATTLAERTADGLRAVGLVLALAVLPFLAVTAALDGRSWTGVLTCDTDSGTGPHRTRLIELGRVGNGVVGWDLMADQVVNAVDCATYDNDVIRPPWWRDQGEPGAAGGPPHRPL
ncbi:hypothetical protein ACIQNG_38320 [Streptomyces sp. NPDC091377]|uniref:hypothetical protein n=1 Tax=Streptomyces sp. NPDC091377 TaxID=3365995 RepID=UPI0038188628